MKLSSTMSAFFMCLACMMTAVAMPAPVEREAMDELLELTSAAATTPLKARFAALREKGSADHGLRARAFPANSARTTVDVFGPGDNIAAWAECRGENPQPWNVCMRVEILDTPGHNHTSRRPPVVISEPRCYNNIPGNTRVDWDWTTPLFAARLKTTWTYSGWCQGTPFRTDDSKVSGLSPLGAGDAYDLVGSNSSHPDNHNGASQTLTGLPAIAAQYRREFPNDPKLAFNDISLPWGGLFDVDLIENPWNAPHKTHRYGYQSDVRIISVPERNRSRLEQIMRDNGARILIETDPPHYHLDFTPRDSPFYEEELACY